MVLTDHIVNAPKAGYYKPIALLNRHHSFRMRPHENHLILLFSLIKVQIVLFLDRSQDIFPVPRNRQPGIRIQFLMGKLTAEAVRGFAPKYITAQEAEEIITTAAE